MRVDVTIKKGRHSPSLWWRLLHLRVWLLRVPTEAVMQNVSVHLMTADGWAELRGISMSLLAATYKDADLRNQTNKLGGLAWGFPRYSRRYGCWIHPNSNRRGFNLSPGFCSYSYMEGLRLCVYGAPEKSGRIMTAGNNRRKPIAYFLMPYFGGEIPAPCDVRISYDIKFLF